MCFRTILLMSSLLGLALFVGVGGSAGASSSKGSEHAQSQISPAGMVWIPGGEFTMGSNLEIARADEKPAHQVHVDGFWMDATEVTNAQFRKFVEMKASPDTSLMHTGFRCVATPDMAMRTAAN